MAVLSYILSAQPTAQKVSRAVAALSGLAPRTQAYGISSIHSPVDNTQQESVLIMAIVLCLLTAGLCFKIMNASRSMNML